MESFFFEQWTPISIFIMWVCNNEFSVLVCLESFSCTFIFEVQLHCAEKYFVSVLWGYCCLIFWFLFSIFSCLYYCLSFEGTVLFFSGCLQDFSLFSLLFTPLWFVVLFFLKKILIGICFQIADLISPLVGEILILIIKYFL